ncbi:hypothetical protein DNTS_013988, partial [Danionella cerebrum]
DFETGIWRLVRFRGDRGWSSADGGAMAPFPDEVDLFTAPHWRMKQLVGLYSEKLSKTNFSNVGDFRSFLQSLLETFTEFKKHERIENECIMEQLQQRSHTIYHVHADNKLSEMLTLFQKGLRSVKYFSYEELKAIKRQVMLQHCSEGSEVLKSLSLWSHAEELQRAFKYTQHQKSTGRECSGDGVFRSLPVELLLRIFSCLSPLDLSRCAQVCSVWSQVVKSGSLWRHLYPVHWARGDYRSGPPADLDQEPDELWVKSLQDEALAFHEWDEDADVDETEEVSGGSVVFEAVQREQMVMSGVIQHLLPAVGGSVRSLSLAYSATLSSKRVRQILSLCPNLTHLDLTQTDVCDAAFDSWSSFGGCRHLEHLDLSGCDKITDRTLKNLSLGLGVYTPLTPGSQATTVKAPPTSLGHQDEPMGRSCKDLIFKRRPGGRGSGCGPAHIWVLNPVKLGDIEDGFQNKKLESGLGTIFEPHGGGGSCCCERSRRRGFRTGLSSSYWKYSMSDCGHSSCCTSDMAHRTMREAPCHLQATRCRADFRTKCSLEAQSCSERRCRTDQSGSARALRFLSLSGCYQVTDLGLRSVCRCGGLPLLEHLNLSGCPLVTGVGLQEMVSACPSLKLEHFYYCDNINGPHADTASGCQNLQCGFRVCCRSGE